MTENRTQTTNTHTYSINSTKTKYQQSPYRQERRCCARSTLSCPVTLQNAKKQALAHSRTDNISNSGCYITLTPGVPFESKQKLHLKLMIPRQTRNTYMLEPVEISAKVVRLQEIPARNEFALALQFNKPSDLQLE